MQHSVVDHPSLLTRVPAQAAQEHVMPDLAAAGLLDPCATDAVLRERLARAEAHVKHLEEKLSEAIDYCVALERLHASTEHADVLLAIQDVVINLVGSEELAIYEPRSEGGWAVVQSFGVGGSRVAPVPDGDGAVGRAAAEGRPWIAGDGGGSDDRELTACVPLMAEGHAVGVLAIWRLLPHKPTLRASDLQIFGLLGAHGGRALYLTARAARSARA